MVKSVRYKKIFFALNPCVCAIFVVPLQPNSFIMKKIGIIGMLPAGFLMAVICLAGFLMAGFLMVGCTALEKKQQAGAAVELNGQYLYRSTLDSLTAGLDSIGAERVRDQYIRQWAEDILVFDQGERRISGRERAEIERMVEAYRHSLYAQAHEHRLIERRMSKTIVDSAVVAVYMQMPDRFKLNESIIKGVLVVVPQGAPNVDKLKQWMAKQSLDAIEKYVYQNASGYELFLDKWMTTTQMLSRMPIERADLEAKLRSGNHIEVTDSTKIYLLQVKEKHMRGEAMPIEFARPQIEKMILNARQVEFLREERERMYEEAVRENKIKFF